LPRPLTILVLGFAWVQSTSPIVALVLLSLSAGTATTISAVALLATVCALLYRCRSDASTACFSLCLPPSRVQFRCLDERPDGALRLSSQVVQPDF
jgi:hypothetical protein